MNELEIMLIKHEDQLANQDERLCQLENQLENQLKSKLDCKQDTESISDLNLPTKSNELTITDQIYIVKRRAEKKKTSGNIVLAGRVSHYTCERFNNYWNKNIHAKGSVLAALVEYALDHFEKVPTIATSEAPDLMVS